MRIDAAHVETGAFDNLRDHRQGRLFPGRELDPNHATPPDFDALREIRGDAVGVLGGGLRDVYFAKRFKTFRLELGPNLLGSGRFRYPFCHFQGKDR